MRVHGLKPTPAQRALLRDLDAPGRYGAVVQRTGLLTVVARGPQFVGWHGARTAEACLARGWTRDRGGIVRLTAAGRRALGEGT